MVEKLDWLKRFIFTALGFVFFGIAGVTMIVVLYPFTRDPANNSLASQQKARRLVSKIWLIFVNYLRFTGVLSVTYHGLERLGRPGQVILANHPSLLDVVLLFSQKPELNCIVKADLLNNPSMRSSILACGFIPNTEDENLLDKIDRVLLNEPLLIFPEGTRTGMDGKVVLNRGAVSVGLRSGKVITPVVIKMTPPSLKKGQPWYKIASHKMCYEIIVGEDIDVSALLAEKPIPVVSRRLKSELEAYFNQKTLS